MRRVLFFERLTLLFSFLACSFSISAGSWINIDGGAKVGISKKVLESSMSRCVVAVKIHGLSDELIKKGDTEFHQLSFGDGFSLCRVGEPSLPVISELFAIPDNGSCQASIAEGKWTRLRVGKLLPTQQQVKGTERQLEFAIDKNAYSISEYKPSMIVISEKMNWKGIDNVRINVCPFVYHPQSGELDVLHEFTIQVDFKKSSLNKESSYKMPITINDVNVFCNSNILGNVVGSNLLRTETRSASDNYDYLIIAGDIFGVTSCQSIKDFMRWKSFKGLKTKIVTTSVTGTTDTAIKNYIIQESAKGIRFVLFIGDDDKIPLHTKQITSSESAKSDYWYGCLGGENDDVADVAIGRFPTNSLAELENMVMKTIRYESQGRPYYDKALLVAHHESTPFSFINSLEYIRMANYQDDLDFSRCYGAISVFGGTNATNTTLLQEINSGYNIINYQGHGLYDRWNEWSYIPSTGYIGSFTSGDVSSINDSVCSVFFCPACLTGNIKDQTCLMEAMMRLGHGAAVYIGATESVYVGVNGSYNSFLFEELLNNSIWHVGELSNRAVFRTLNPSSYYYFREQLGAYSYICGGDPSLEIWTDIPQAAGRVTMWEDGNNILIRPTEMSDFTYSVTDENGNLIETGIPADGICTVSKPTTRCYVTINKHNYLPCVILIDSREMFIQNKTFDHSALYLGAIYGIGYNVYNGTNYGDVIIKSGNTLKIITDYDVKIKNGFECEKGATLEIKL